MHNHITQEDTNVLELTELLKSRKFDEADDLLALSFKESQIIRTLHQITEQSLGLITYTFVNYLIQKHPSAFWHKVAACIASESLNISQGFNAGLYHILEAIELEPDDYLLKEYALGFFNKGVLSKEKAKIFAQHVLQFEPNNKLASRILAE